LARRAAWVTFNRQARGAPFFKAAAEIRDVRVAGGEQFFRGGGGSEIPGAGDIDHQRCVAVRRELPHVVKKRDVIDAGVFGAGKVRGAKLLLGQNVDEQWWRGAI